jgi:GNAT superfamily N-acetyltransferase
VEIRDARPGDGEALAAIWLEVGRLYASLDADEFRVPEPDGLVGWFEEILARPPARDRIHLVAVVEGEIAGAVSAYLEEPDPAAQRQILAELALRRVFVNAVEVAERFRRRGVATALVDAAETWARDAGAELIATSTWVEGPLALPFWEQRMGYRRRSVELEKRLWRHRSGTNP